MKREFFLRMYFIVLAGFWFRWCFVLYVCTLFLGLEETRDCHFQLRGSLRVGVLKLKREGVTESIEAMSDHR